MDALLLSASTIDSILAGQAAGAVKGTGTSKRSALALERVFGV